MEYNNFKMLDDLNISERAPSGKEKTKTNIQTNLEFLNLLGNILDVYVPRAGEVILSFGQTDAVKSQDKK
ncbi:MAG: hypothetical protein J5I52_10055 [Saprospiraceae bacterium]|nr:MAG: hypothetical protein UZ09_BCD002001120 [Bacteroidetes bacterium OLB9]MCO6464477.1 hypothetical protein [Saprospiraceae bacterium]MCZ2339981.1 hypothetical protein [Chitinophagales bacterium]